MIGYFLSSRADVVVEELEEVPKWKLLDPGPLRTAGPLVQMESVSFSYPVPAGKGSCFTNSLHGCYHQIPLAQSFKTA